MRGCGILRVIFECTTTRTTTTSSSSVGGEQRCGDGFWVAVEGATRRRRGRGRSGVCCKRVKGEKHARLHV